MGVVGLVGLVFGCWLLVVGWLIILKEKLLLERPDTNKTHARTPGDVGLCMLQWRFFTINCLLPAKSNQPLGLPASLSPESLTTILSAPCMDISTRSNMHNTNLLTCLSNEVSIPPGRGDAKWEPFKETL